MTTPNANWPAVLGAGAVVLVAQGAHAQVWRTHEPHVLGASLDMAVVADHPASALAAAQAARAEIDRLDAILSGWRADSELTRLNRASAAAVSTDLFVVVEAAERWRLETGGAFDARLGAVTAAWKRGAGDAAALDAASRAEPIGLDRATCRVVRPEAAVFDLDGIAKGHVIDAALAAARRAAPQMAGMLIDIGGDVRVWGQAPSVSGWRIGVADPARLHDNAAPAQTIWINDQAVAFSGPGARDLMVGGEPRPHILSAGGAPARRVSAAVIGPTARDADALATALCAMPAHEAIALADRLGGFEAMVIDEDGRRLSSRGWPGLDSAPEAPARLQKAQAARPWPAGYALTIDYEVPVINRERAQPPYVAFWITDQNGQPVRTLALLGSDLRFIDQNFIWWRRVGRAMGDYDTVTRPTRRPGRYSIVWDGKDDKGVMLGQGRYTVHVEATREHGGHGYQTFEVTLGAAPVTATAAGEAELGAGAVRYGPR